MTEHLTDQQLVEYVYRALTDDQRAEMDRHLATCTACRAQLAGHEVVQRRIHNNIVARRNAAPPPSRLTYAAIATRVHPRNRAIRLGREFNRLSSGALAAAALLALVILLIGMFSSARQAAVSVRPTLATPPLSRAPRLVWKIEGNPDPLKSPSRLALNSQGNLYAVDAGNDRILKYDRDGKFLTQWGGHGAGDNQFNFGVTILAATGYTETVAGGSVAIDTQGNIYVADTMNARIQKFDSNGKFLLKWGSTGGGAGQFGHLVGVAVDGQGNVYTAEDDPASRVQKFDSNGQFLLQWSTHPADNGSAFHPYDIAIDHQDLIYLPDLVSGSIQTYDETGRFISNWTPHCGSRIAILGLSSITFDSSGNLYAADYVSRRICKFDRNGQLLTQWDDSAASGHVSLVQGIVVDAQGDVYVVETENDRILKFQQP